jgi:purine nucleosidase
MRRLLIDTDTGSDDAVAIVMALRESSVRVEAITTVMGNVSLPAAMRNAAASVAAAESYSPPIFAGAAHPLLRRRVAAESVHGPDGMSGAVGEGPAPELSAGHAALAIIEAARRFPGELELLTLGPLTNLALALSLDPGIAALLKGATLMAGTGLGPGNISAAAEFNVFADAEAAAIALRYLSAEGTGGLPVLVGWDACLGEALLGEADARAWAASGSRRGIFCERCTRSLRTHYSERLGLGGFGLADPAAAAAALRPDLVRASFEARAEVETGGAVAYGLLSLDRRPGASPNARAVTALDGPGFRAYLLGLLGG